MHYKKLFNLFFNKKNKSEEKSLTNLIKNNELNLNDYYKKVITNIIEMSNITVKEIFIPRVDVVSIDIKSNIREIIKIIEEKGHSRLPVYDKSIDNIIGILHSKDLLKSYLDHNNLNLEKLIRPPLFVPESKFIMDLLLEFREKKMHMAIVVDEYGGMSGIVCFEDIIEEFIGDIQDEFDNELEDIQIINDNTFLISSRISVEELNERFNTDFDAEEFDTLGGVIYMLFGKIPAKNDKIQYKNFLFTIESIQGRKIKLIKMEIIKDKDPDQK